MTAPETGNLPNGGSPEGPDAGAAPPAPPTTPAIPPEPPAEPTFTQAQLDAQLATRLAREKAKYEKMLEDAKKSALPKEQLEAFETWQNSQQSEAERIEKERTKLTKEKLEAENKMKEALKKAEWLERMNATRDADVPSKFVKFITTEASERITDDVDYAAALKATIEEYSAMWADAETPPPPGQPPPPVKFGSGVPPGNPAPPSEAEKLKAAYQEAKKRRDGVKMSAIVDEAHSKGINIYAP